MKRCACGCGVTFQPTQATKRFATRKCAGRVRERRRGPRAARALGRKRNRAELRAARLADLGRPDLEEVRRRLASASRHVLPLTHLEKEIAR